MVPNQVSQLIQSRWRSTTVILVCSEFVSLNTLQWKNWSQLHLSYDSFRWGDKLSTGIQISRKVDRTQRVLRKGFFPFKQAGTLLTIAQVERVMDIVYETKPKDGLFADKWTSDGREFSSIHSSIIDLQRGVAQPFNIRSLYYRRISWQWIRIFFETMATHGWYQSSWPMYEGFSFFSDHCGLTLFKTSSQQTVLSRTYFALLLNVNSSMWLLK